MTVLGPHRPLSTSAGHFLSMQPIVPDGKPVTPDSVWYRGDEHERVVLERDRYRAGLQAIVGLFDKEDVEMLDFLEVAEGALK